MVRRFLIDTDTASDDAVAILMAHRWPDVQVDAVTIVAGNVPVEMGARNAGYTIELCGKDTPVYVGCDRPLMREPRWAFFFHGPDGMGGMNYPAPSRPPQPEHAVDALIRLIRARPGEYTLVTLGPLTNIALALRRAPEIARLVRQCYVMGGAACTVGNITPAAEYNIWVDPEAARIVFHSGMPILMVGWEHCRGEAAFDDAGMEELRRLGTPYARFVLDCNRTAIEVARRWLGDPGLTLPDPVTMSIALDPAVCISRSRHFVDVETASDLTRGMTVVDRHGVLNRDPNVEVCWAIDVRRWKDTLYATLR
ncbi:MAG: nucleoside hydrolase [Armatimonadota bacterium]|nr:nucleoside hydrolase [Armatimonadota bacterium]MDR7402704.1 nucleoside hydrolase [Armatimonadota bacterium]MDR7403521.1 nucleoside hydrolase [Armatimonadota bacterium]MDR7437746.1 nucleoside hydrolase [Armatimonadota bacterium]MDR7473291.1 nucleoside hydrolase [Armatimonadota bacterium]